MITNTTAKKTYTIAEGVYSYEIGFQYGFNPNGAPQIRVYLNKLSNTPLVYGVDYNLSEDGLNVVLVSINAGDRLDIVRDIPMVQLSDYVIGRIDPEQVEHDFDEAVMRDQEIKAKIDLAIEIPEDHEERIQQNTVEINTIESYIPSQTSNVNQLADKNFVNSSIATATATFQGTYTSVDDLANIQDVDNNDYAFVVTTDSLGHTLYNRYKYTTATDPASWVYEYTLNNSSFTAIQWAAINSGITSAKVTKVDNMPVLITQISVNESTGVISVVAHTNITTLSVRKLYGRAAISGNVSVSGATATFTPTTVSDITMKEWTIEVS